jgi:lysophospholipid hydrolase
MFHNYLDEFLQAIRVFGFLEKPVCMTVLNSSDEPHVYLLQVFHELARHLQTRRLIAGDSLYLDQDKSFYCVIDGMVQVYAQTGRPIDQDSVQWDEEDMNGYQLLNEVGSGGTLSSLFTILSLFTEDVKISWQHAVADADRMHSAQAQERLSDHMSRRDIRSRGNSDASESGRSDRVRSPGTSSSSGSTVLVREASVLI